MDYSQPTSARPPHLPTSTSLEDPALFSVASSGPERAPLRSIDSPSPSGRWFKMGLFYNKDGAPVASSTSTPKKHHAPADAGKLLSPEAMYCDSPSSSAEHYSLFGSSSIHSSETIRPNLILKSKKSIAKLLDLTLPGSTMRSSSEVSAAEVSFSSTESEYSVVLAPTPPSNTSPTTSYATTTGDEEDCEGSDEEEEYYFPTSLRRRGIMLHHPFSHESAPYMQAYSVISLNSDYCTYDLLYRLAHSPTFHDYGDSPPLHVLDLGCGEGYWAAATANKWKEAGTKVTAFDLVDLSSAVRDHMEPDVAGNVLWMRGNFLKNPLPFKDDSFDLVRMANLNLAVPRSRWLDLLTDIRRILKPGGRLEFVDDELVFAYQPPFTQPLYQELCRAYGSVMEHEEAILEPLLEKDEHHPAKLFFLFERKRRMAETIEKIFERMLAEKYDIVVRLHEVLPEMLASVFGRSETRVIGTFHLNMPNRNPDKGGEGIGRRFTEGEGSKLGGYFDRLGKDAKGKKDSSHQASLSVTGPFINPGLLSPSEDAVKMPKVRRMLVEESDSKRRLPAYQPTGLVVFPNTYMELDSGEVEMHACRSAHTLLACKHALGQYVRELNEAAGETLVTEKEFDEIIWQYDCYKRLRMNWPRYHSEFRINGFSLAKRLLGKKSKDMGSKDSAPSKPSTHRSQSVGGVPLLDGVKFAGGASVPVRSIRVFGATKA